MENKERQNTLRIRRGEPYLIRVDVKKDGEAYVMRKTDRIRMVIRKDSLYRKVIVLERIAIGRTEIRLRPEDTEKLTPGKYKYTLELMEGTGAVWPITAPDEMEVVGV